MKITDYILEVFLILVNLFFTFLCLSVFSAPPSLALLAIIYSGGIIIILGLIFTRFKLPKKIKKTLVLTTIYYGIIASLMAFIWNGNWGIFKAVGIIISLLAIAINLFIIYKIFKEKLLNKTHTNM